MPPKQSEHLTPDVRERFLALVRQTANISWSARHSGLCSTRSVYTLRDNDPEFAEELREALDEAVGRLEEFARKRAVGETMKPLHHQGYLTGDEVPDQSDTVLLRLLAAHRPDRYGNKVDVQSDNVVEFVVRDVVAEALAAEDYSSLAE